MEFHAGGERKVPRILRRIMSRLRACRGIFFFAFRPGRLAVGPKSDEYQMARQNDTGVSLRVGRRDGHWLVFEIDGGIQ